MERRWEERENWNCGNTPSPTRHLACGSSASELCCHARQRTAGDEPTDLSPPKPPKKALRTASCANGSVRTSFLTTPWSFFSDGAIDPRGRRPWDPPRATRGWWVETHPPILAPKLSVGFIEREDVVGDAEHDWSTCRRASDERAGALQFRGRVMIDEEQLRNVLYTLGFTAVVLVLLYHYLEAGHKVKQAKNA